MSDVTVTQPVTDERSTTVQLLTLAAPIIAMMISRMLMSFIDFAMVSQLGTEAQAAISPASIFVFFLGCLGLGIANGVQTFVAQSEGRGEPEQCGSYAWQGLYIAMIFAVLTLPASLTTESWYGAVARLGNHPDAVRQMQVDYVRLALWSIAPAILCISFNGFFNGVQKPWITAVAVTASLVTNVCGNWLLIFGNLGFPELGIQGAAISTVIAWCVRAGVLMLALITPRFDRQYNTRRALAPDGRKLKRLVGVGAPTSIGWLVDIGSWLVFMMLIVPMFGEAAMAASNAGFQYMHLSFMPALGIGIALCSKVGFFIGEGKPETAFRWTRVAFGLTGTYMGAIGLLFFFAGPQLTWLFNDDPEVIAAGGIILAWAAVFQVFDAMAITHMNALRGAGDTRIPAILLGTTCYTVFIGGGWALATWRPDLGLHGPWSMCTLYIIVVGLLLLWRWKGGAWRNIRLFDDHAARTVVDVPDESPLPVALDEAAVSADDAPEGTAPR